MIISIIDIHHASCFLKAFHPVFSHQCELSQPNEHQHPYEQEIMIGSRNGYYSRRTARIARVGSLRDFITIRRSVSVCIRIQDVDQAIRIDICIP